MVKYTQIGAAFPRPGDAGHGVCQFLSLKKTKVPNPFGMDFINKPTKKLQ